MMKNRIVIIISFYVFLKLVAFGQEIPDQDLNLAPYWHAKFTIKVVDENLLPMERVSLHVPVRNDNDYKDGYNDFRGETDSEGLFIIESKAQGSANITAKKNGYYESFLEWTTLNLGFCEKMEGRSGYKMEPWNPIITIMLKKIVSPVSLKARIVTGSEKVIKVPGIDKEYGFDLVNYDWVAPHGSGSISDLMIQFNLLDSKEDKDVYVAKIRCGNVFDGMVEIRTLQGKESMLKLPRLAPEDGYLVKTLEISSTPCGNWEESAKMRGYFFRIRTKIDPSSGDVVSAFYGKIFTDEVGQYSFSPFQIRAFAWDNREKRGVRAPGFSMSYYLNPRPNDRNLEYDQHTNLIPGSAQDLYWPP